MHCGIRFKAPRLVPGLLHWGMRDVVFACALVKHL